MNKTPKNLIVIIAVSLCLFLSGTTMSQEKATKEECVQKVKAAAQMAKDGGLGELLKKLNDPKGPFVWKDSYVFAIDIEKGTNLAHPILKHSGKVVTHLKDKNGKKFFLEYVNVAKSEKGEGWVSYMWPKPNEKKPSKKITYVYRVPETSVALLAGIYE